MALTRRSLFGGIAAAIALAALPKPQRRLLCPTFPEPIQDDFYSFILREHFTPVIADARRNQSTLERLLPDRRGKP